MKAYVYVSLKKTVLDPQGKTIHGALKKMGYKGVADLRQGKYFEIELNGGLDQAQAKGLTVLMGLILAYTNGYLVEALSFRSGFQLIGTGMWLGLIMAFNVWVIIWPNQKKVLGLVPADDAAKAKATKAAMIASRTNLLLSIPLLLAMTNFR